jgi:hypothetical protein
LKEVLSSTATERQPPFRFTVESGKTRIPVGWEKLRCKDREAARRTWMDDMEQKKHSRKRAGRRWLALAMASYCVKKSTNRVLDIEHLGQGQLT